MVYIADIEKDEIRDDYPVSAKMKRVWQKEIEILLLIDKICKKYNLKYWLEYGSLLGAVRHQGFIPWDDDLDIAMMRPDYERFKQVAPLELAPPFSLENAYNSPFLTAFSKIRNAETTAIEFPDNLEMNQGIFVDIFPYDDMPDGSPTTERIFQIQRELWCCIINPAEIEKAIREKWQLTLKSSLLEKILSLPHAARMQEFEEFCLHHFGNSEYINFITGAFFKTPHVKREWYNELIQVPFEEITVPIPVNYHEALQARYHDYMVPIRGLNSHTNLFLDPDVPYEYYLKNGLPNK